MDYLLEEMEINKARKYYGKRYKKIMDVIESANPDGITVDTRTDTLNIYAYKNGLVYWFVKCASGGYALHNYSRQTRFTQTNNTDKNISYCKKVTTQYGIVILFQDKLLEEMERKITS